MKKLVRNTALLLLGAVIELGMLAAPLAGTVYAGEKPAAIHDAAQERPSDIKERHDNQDKGRPQLKEERHDGDRDRDHDRDRDKDWRGGDNRDNHRRWDREYFHHRMEMYREWLIAHQAAGVNQSPVTVVMSAANILGFDVNADTFTLISQGAGQAVVQVAHDGGMFNITLNNANGVWTVAEMVQA